MLCDKITYSREAGGGARRWEGRIWGTEVVERLLLGLLRMPGRSVGEIEKEILTVEVVQTLLSISHYTLPSSRASRPFFGDPVLLAHDLHAHQSSSEIVTPLE